VYQSLTIDPGGSLDIGSASMTIDYGPESPSPLPDVQNELATGAITSNQLAGNPSSAIGYADGSCDDGTPAQADTVLIKYTLLGDANLDGQVNFQDLVAVVQNLNKAGTDWAHGNFQNASETNFSDLVDVVQNFNKPLTPPPVVYPPAPLPTFTSSTAVEISVPKPAIAIEPMGRQSVVNPPFPAPNDPDGTILYGGATASLLL
jgi:hypothetical protein